MSIVGLGDGKPGRRTEEEVTAMYESWLITHGKSYNAMEEKERRFQIFRDNLRFVDAHNAGNRTYKVGLNRFADLTNEEYRSTYLDAKRGFRRRVSTPEVSDRYAPRAGDDLPDSVDWRKKGAVVDVKDQGSCVKEKPTAGGLAKPVLVRESVIAMKKASEIFPMWHGG
ncbi:hypothetical protein U1Q18_016362 [Sarracenia purpurea var. burkii]